MISTTPMIAGVPVQTVVTVCSRVIVFGDIIDRTPGKAVYRMHILGVRLDHMTEMVNRGGAPVHRRVLKGERWSAWVEHKVGVSGAYYDTLRSATQTNTSSEVVWGNSRYALLGRGFEGDKEVFGKTMLYASMIGDLDDWQNVAGS